MLGVPRDTISRNRNWTFYKLSKEKLGRGSGWAVYELLEINLLYKIFTGPAYHRAGVENAGGE